MNGRIYDPKLARFPQADPFVQAITSSQSLNRYSYGFNNPLNGTDPSGYDFRNFIVISIFYTVFDFITDQPPHEPTIPSIGNPIVDHVAVGTVGGAFGRSAVIPDRTSYTNVTVFDATTGETDSEQTGGKFANGAATDSFGYTIADVIVGASDSYFKTVTLGLGDLSAVHRTLGIQGAIDEDSAAYRGGDIAGQIVGIALGAAAVVRGAIAGTGGLRSALGTRAAAEGATEIVASNGTRIRGLTRHGINRAIGDAASRAGTKPQAILDALKNPKKITEGVDNLGRSFQVFYGNTARVVVNPQSGKIVSTNPLSAVGAQ